MKYLILLLILLNTANAKKITKDEMAYIETEKYVRSNRNYHMPNNTAPSNGLNFGIKMTMYDDFYQHIKAVSLTDSSQFRFAGLKGEFGYRYGQFELYFRHFSGHALDSTYDDDIRFPEDNCLGIRFTILGGKK